MKIFNFALIVAPLLVSACSVRTPDCADRNTQKLVLEATNEQIGEFLASDFGKGLIKMAFTQIVAMSNGKLKNSERYSEIKYSLDNIVTTSNDENIGKYTCKANLVSSLDGNKTEIEISFSSEMANNGEKHLVRTQKLRFEDFSALLAAALSEK